jgi:nitronate monooxygenase
VVKAVEVPVLAAGGLATGSDLVAAMALGAEGIVLGTALIATDESFAHDFHKQCLVAADGTDTVLTRAFHINWPPGAAVRVFKSAVTNDGTPHVSAQRIVIGEDDGRPIYLFSTDSPLRSMTGDFASMPLYAGTGVGHIHTIEPAKARIEHIVGEANGILAKATPAPIEELTSAVCYVGEFSGAYTGTLDAHELNAELKALCLELQSLLARAELEGRSGALPDVAWTPWILALRQQMPDWSYPTRDATSIEALLERLTRLLPRMVEGAARQSLFELRTVLEREIARAQVPPSV